ncbi:DUF2817 domain-containing protein, partial [bacterium]|nr:DUF2817 domain-containing protein [bacterium]
MKLVHVAIAAVLLFAPMLQAETAFFERETAAVEGADRALLSELAGEGYIIDRVVPVPGGQFRIELFLNAEEFQTLQERGLQVHYIANPAREYRQALERRTRGSGNELDDYHTFEELEDTLQTIADAYPEITNLFSVGQSIQGRDLWMMEISNNVNLEEDEPELLYISTMHGDEVVGMENCLRFIDKLTSEYPTDPQVTNLVDNTHLYIMPLMNPDGMEAGSRFNADGIDLNRNFPDRIDDPYDTGDGRAPETRALMTFIQTHAPVLAANFHGGTVVVNYPWDGNPDRQSVYT